MPASERSGIADRLLNISSPPSPLSSTVKIFCETGSYIFSQTLFTRRTGCDSRLVGWVVTVSELVICVVTVDPLAFVPLAFFAATLTFIGETLAFLSALSAWCSCNIEAILATRGFATRAQELCLS